MPLTGPGANGVLRAERWDTVESNTTRDHAVRSCERLLDSYASTTYVGELIHVSSFSPCAKTHFYLLESFGSPMHSNLIYSIFGQHPFKAHEE